LSLRFKPSELVSVTCMTCCLRSLELFHAS
jgi:hypothetical protein